MQQHILQRVYVKNNDDKTLDVKCGINRNKKNVWENASQ